MTSTTPETITIPVYVYAEWNSWNHDWDYKVFTHDMTSLGYTILEKTSITIPAREHADLAHIAARHMRAQQQSIRAEAEVKIQLIEEEIGKLAALTFSSEPVSSV